MVEETLAKDRKKAEGREMGNGFHYSEIAETLPGIVYQFVLHPDGSFSMPYVNRRVQNYSDRSPEEFTENPSLIFEHVPPEDVTRIWKAIQESAKTLEKFTVEYRRMPPDRGEAWFQVDSAPQMLPNGDILWNGVMLDITDRKTAEQALKDSEERIRLIAEGIREVFWVGSSDWKEVYYVSPAYENIWGRSVESLYEQPFSWMESLPPEDRRRINGYVAGLPVGDLDPGVFPDYRVIQKDGSIRWMAARYYPIKDDQGRVYRVVGIAEDITERKNSEAEIRRLAAIVESSDDAIYVLNLNGEIVEWNQGAERLYGYEKSDVIGRPASIIIPARAPDDSEQILEKIKLDIEIDHYETVRMSRQGREIHVSLMVSPVKDDAGEVVGASAIARDITHRKQIEQERELTIELLCLINRELNLHDLMKDVTEMLQQWSGCEAVGIRLRDGNDYPYYETNGFPAAFVRAESRLCARNSKGQPILDGIGNPVLECMCGNVIQGRFDPRLPFFTANGSFWTNSTTDLLASTSEADRQARTRNRCHGEGYESVALVPLRSGDETFGLLQFNDPHRGRFNADKISLFEQLANSLALGLAHRITLNRLSESEARYRLLFENAEVLVSIFDWDGICLVMNDKLAELFGGEPADLQGKSLYELHPDGVEEYIGRIRKVIDTGETGKYEDFVEYPKGSRWILSTLQPVRDSTGRIYATQSVTQDITERKRAELEKSQLESQLRQAQKMEAIGTLAGGIAHDFNNILAAIIGYTELALYDTPEGMPVRPNLEQILRAGQRAKDLINQILAFSRKADSEREVIQLGTIVKESLKMLRATIPTTIDIKQNIRPDSLMAEADPTQVHQLLINLCTNAADAMREHGGILSVELGAKTLDGAEPAIQADIPPGRYVVLTVADTGAGMDPQVKERIFDPFFTTKSVGRGTGMGLSVVHGIVSGHGGFIQVESEPGRGTVFYVYLPASTASPKVDAKTSTAGLSKGSGRILFVDDESALVDFARQMFPRLGYEVTAVNSSSEAFELFRDNLNHFDLIITDMTMPGLTGVDLAREIHGVNPNLPIILCTGFSDQISLKSMKDYGIRHLLNKPIDVKQVARLISDILGGNQTDR